MKFPQRNETHQIEAASWKVLLSQAPDNWIVREVTERDYGIDAYIEIATESGDVTGNLISIQLKGVKKFKWAENKKGKHKSIRSPSIKTETAAYWLGLPVPVFLFVADISRNEIYYTPVEETIRREYEKLDSQDTISFKLSDELRLTSDIGRVLFNWFVGRERSQGNFEFHITNLLSHTELYEEFICANQMRDCFMEIEADRHLQFRALYESCRMASIYFNNEWDIDSLYELYRKDRRDYQDEYALLHEGTLGYALQKIERKFPHLVRQAIELIGEKQSKYWREKSPVFHSLCSSGELIYYIRNMEERLSR